VVVAVVVPALGLEGAQKLVHRFSWSGK